jgi:hypothetical protein
MVVLSAAPSGRKRVSAFSAIVGGAADAITDSPPAAGSDDESLSGCELISSI